MTMKRCLIILSAIVTGCSSSVPDEPDLAPLQPDTAARPEPHHAIADEINPRLLRRFKPLQVPPSATGAAEAEIELGRMLFFDKRLSRSRDLACSSCHRLDTYGVDHEVTSIGAGGKRGRRNSPSVFHAAGQFSNFWDGRAATVEAQAMAPIVNPTEMGMLDGDAVVAVLAASPGYVRAFRAAYPGVATPLTYEAVGTALGAFERVLVTPGRWDRFLQGDRRALSSLEIHGLKLFSDVGCISCHTGELLGGTMFRKAGVEKPWPNQADQGRFEITKLEVDRMMFKVPPLRNVAMTAPYFHDGSVATLEEAVALMAHHQLGEELAPADVTAIVAWLRTLTGELPARYVAAPTLPPDL